MTQTIEQLTARVRELEEENARLKAECDDIKQVQFPRKLEAVAVGWKKQLAAAQEELRAANSECYLFRKNGRISDANEIATLKDQLAKAEQRVAEACALQVATEIKFHWLDAARVAKEIRSGEWRKFVKEV